MSEERIEPHFDNEPQPISAGYMVEADDEPQPISAAEVEQYTQPATPEEARQGPHPEHMLDSEKAERTSNNAMRHQYKLLNDLEKAQMLGIKDIGQVFHDYISTVADENGGMTRELSLALTKIEEAVMWGVKHVTK